MNQIVSAIGAIAGVMSSGPLYVIAVATVAGLIAMLTAVKK